MAADTTPMREQPLVEDQFETTPWTLACERLANPIPGQTSWLRPLEDLDAPAARAWIDAQNALLAG